MFSAFTAIVISAWRKPIAFFSVYFSIFTLSYGVLYFFDIIPTHSASLYSSLELTSILLLLGILAGVLQLVGYLLYLGDENIDPNPVTWFMFAYGTLVLMILEWDIDATLAELILPTVCGLLAVVVSARCWVRARRLDPSRLWPHDWWPEDRFDKLSFISDILITIAYIFAWGLATYAILTLAEREFAVAIFLFLSNLSTFPAFYPILHSTYKNPEREHWLPWMVWALAYAVLGVVTYVTHGELWHALMFYPVSNAILHALVGVVALRPRASVTV